MGTDALPVGGQTTKVAEPPEVERQLRADAARNRKRLLVAAAESFAERGADVPLEDIARSAGVGIGTLYRHFPTRDCLVEAVYRHEIDSLCESADRLLGTLPPDQALAAWMQLFVRHVATKRGMLAALKSMMGGDTTLFEQSRARAGAAASKLLEAGAKAGTIRSDVRGADLLRAISGVCMSTDDHRTETAQLLVTLLYDGLRRGAGETQTAL